MRAASEVVRVIKEPKVSSAIYPLMQTVDVKRLGSEVVGAGAIKGISICYLESCYQK